MAWKNFQNGYPLYASELNNYLMNQSVATFASSTERASVLTSPVEGQVTWLQDTNAFQVYNGSAWVDINDNTDAIQKSLLTTAGDTIYATGSATPARLALGSTGSLLKSNGSAPTWLGVGTSGQVLSSTGTDLAWTTPAAGGMVLLSTTNLSGASTTVTGIDQTYKKLIIKLQDFDYAGAPTGALGFHVKSSAGTTIDPKFTGFYSYTVGLTGFAAGTFTSAVTPTNPAQVGGGGWTGLQIEIDDYATTFQKPYRVFGTYYDPSGDRAVNFGGHVGWNGTTPAIAQFNATITGTTFNRGTIKIYGVN